jgi:3-(3-hydroxy-phenyl)propionate hydroxylase
LSEDGLDHDGLDNDMARVGLVAPILQFWDRPSPTARRPIRPCGSYERHAASFVVQCEQFKTAKLLLDRLRAYPNVEVLFDHEVIDVSQTSHAVTVQVRGPSDVASHSGGYLIGADGGRSTVRRRSGIKFEGFTWPERFIVLTTPYDFEAERGYCYRRYFADPGAWCNCFKVSADGPPGLWRTVYPTDPAQGEQDILSDAGVQACSRFFHRQSPTRSCIAIFM